MNTSIPTNAAPMVSNSYTIPQNCNGKITFEIILQNGVGGLIGFGVLVNGVAVKGRTI